MQPVSLTFVHGYDLREGIRYMRSLTDKPIGFNALIEKGSKKYLQRMADWIDIALEEDIRFFVTSLGKPDWVCEKVHAAGGFVYHDVTEMKWAQKGIEGGVDGLVCVNERAGGHAGFKSAQLMHDELNGLGLPLICAGGIGGRQDFVEAIKIGYAGVQMGTRFIATEECDSPEAYKQAIIRAREDDIVRTLRLTGVPISVIRSDKHREQNSWLMAKMLASKRLKHRARFLLNIRSLFRFKKMAKSNKPKHSHYWSAGKSVSGVDTIESATEIMRDFGAALERG